MKPCSHSLLVFTLTIFFLCFSRVDGAVSFLLAQGPFGAGATVETYKWQVNYNSGQLVTGQDLLNVVFGAPVDSGTVYTDGFGGTNPYFVSSNGQWGAGYISFNSGLFLESLTISGKKVAQDISYSPGWSYYDAGGTDGAGLIYPDGNWYYANSGTGARQLANGSFDGFVFGADSGNPFYTPPSITGAENMPVASNFASATLIVITPEPGRLVLIWLGISSMVLRRRRTDAPHG